MFYILKLDLFSLSSTECSHVPTLKTENDSKHDLPLMALNQSPFKKMNILFVLTFPPTAHAAVH